MRLPQEFSDLVPRFIGEQDGPSERLLKAKLVSLFAGNEHVTSAYLAQTAYRDQSGIHVALCLSMKRADDEIVAACGRVFASIFGGHEYLDILCLTKEQKEQIESVCAPFFVKDG